VQCVVIGRIVVKFEKINLKFGKVRKSSRSTCRPNHDVSASVKAVVRVISISTKLEDQKKLNVTLFCICHYDDGRRSTVREMSNEPRAIGIVSDIYVGLSESLESAQ